jgi:hypothetical protein
VGLGLVRVPTRYQKASIAEPLYLQGWQLIDELNRASAGQPPSGYVAPPRLITKADVRNGGVFDPPSGYREQYGDPPPLRTAAGDQVSATRATR